MKTLIFVTGLFAGGLVSSSWWAAALWGYGKELSALWAIAGILSGVILVFLTIKIVNTLEFLE